MMMQMIAKSIRGGSDTTRAVMMIDGTTLTARATRYKGEEVLKEGTPTKVNRALWELFTNDNRKTFQKVDTLVLTFDYLLSTCTIEAFGTYHTGQKANVTNSVKL